MELPTTKEAFLDGQVLLIDKPLGWTSFQAVNAIKWAIRRKFDLKKIKVGHAGTLDPLATGLLLVCTGKFTKKIAEYQAQPKEYTGTILLGATTPSYDLETRIDRQFPTSHITPEAVQHTARGFLGEQEQMPPLYSAVKKDGKRLYTYAREGLSVTRNTRPIHISHFEITRMELPEIGFRVVCSKGTYIRSLAHDFGQKLDSGAHLIALRRTKIGGFNVDIALSPDKFRDLLNAALPGD